MFPTAGLQFGIIFVFPPFVTQEIFFLQQYFPVAIHNYLLLYVLMVNLMNCRPAEAKSIDLLSMLLPITSP